MAAWLPSNVCASTKTASQTGPESLRIQPVWNRFLLEIHKRHDPIPQTLQWPIAYVQQAVSARFLGGICEGFSFGGGQASGKCCLLARASALSQSQTPENAPTCAKRARYVGLLQGCLVFKTPPREVWKMHQMPLRRGPLGYLYHFFERRVLCRTPTRWRQRELRLGAEQP